MLALCFSQEAERYHHWRVFSNGPDGVCVQFDKLHLLSCFTGDCRIEHGSVDYKLIEEIKSQPPSVETLPFLKRAPYGDESEYRIGVQ